MSTDTISSLIIGFSRDHSELKPYAKRIYNGLYPDENLDTFELISFPYYDEQTKEICIQVRRPDQPTTIYSENCEWLLLYTIPQLNDN